MIHFDGGGLTTLATKENLKLEATLDTLMQEKAAFGLLPFANNIHMFNPCYCLCIGLSEAANGALLLVPVTLSRSSLFESEPDRTSIEVD